MRVQGKGRVVGLSRGNNYLKTTLVEAAWAASRTKGTYLAAKYHITAKRRGGKRAAVAIGHRILNVVYHILSSGESYKELVSSKLLETENPMRESVQ